MRAATGVLIGAIAATGAHSAADETIVSVDVYSRLTRAELVGPPGKETVEYTPVADDDSLSLQFGGLLSVSTGALVPSVTTTGFGASLTPGASTIQVSTVHDATAGRASVPPEVGSSFEHSGEVVVCYRSAPISFLRRDGGGLPVPVEVTLWCRLLSELAEVGVPVCGTREVELSVHATGPIDAEVTGSLVMSFDDAFCGTGASFSAMGVFGGGSMNQAVTAPLTFTVGPDSPPLEFEIRARTSLETDSFAVLELVTHLLSLQSLVAVGNGIRPASAGGPTEGVFDLPSPLPDGLEGGILVVSDDGRIMDNGVHSCAADLAEPFGTLDFSDVFVYLVAFADMSPIADLAEPFGVFDFSDVFAFLVAFGAGCP